MQCACMGSTGGSAIRSPPNTFQHAELPLNFTENNNFHRRASFSARLLRDGNAHTDAVAVVPGAGAAERKGLWV